MRIVAKLGEVVRPRLLAVSAVVAYVSGLVAYLDAGRSLSDSVYAALQLFFLDFQEVSAAATTPLLLNFSRFLAAAVSLSALLAGGIALFRNSFDRFLAGRMRRHFVVCGLGMRGRHLARALLHEKKRVVVIEIDPHNPHIEELRRLGVPVLIGDATRAPMLRGAGIARADHVIALTDSDTTNADLAAAIRSLQAAQEQETCHVYAHISAAAWDTLMTSLTIQAREFGTGIEWFNVNRIAARALLSDFVEIPGDLVASQTKHIGVVGTNELAQCFVVESAHRMHYLKLHASQTDDLARQTMSIWDPDAILGGPTEISAIEGLSSVVDLRVLRGRDAGSWGGLAQCDVVFLCLEDPMESLGYAWHIAQRSKGSAPKTVICTPVDVEDLAALVSQDPRAGNLELVNVQEIACNHAIVEHSLREELARENHLAYSREVLGEPASVPWSQLESMDRESNRNAAVHHIHRKLPRFDLALRPITDFSATLHKFSADEIEILAEMEHERWMSEKLDQGWKRAPEGMLKQDRHRRLHPDLVPWDELTPAAKDKDRIFIKALPKMLIRTGYTLEQIDGQVPLSSQASVPDDEFRAAHSSIGQTP